MDRAQVGDHGAEGAGAVAGAVVGQHLRDGDPVAGQPVCGALEEAAGGVAAFVVVHLDVGGAGEVVHGDVQVVMALPGAAAAVVGAAGWRPSIRWPPQSGMRPCFLGGRQPRLCVIPATEPTVSASYSGEHHQPRFAGSSFGRALAPRETTPVIVGRSRRPPCPTTGAAIWHLRTQR